MGRVSVAVIRTAALTLATVGVLMAILLGLSLALEGSYWHRHRDRALFAAAKRLSVALAQTQGPTVAHRIAPDTERRLKQDVERVSLECSRLGVAVEHVRVEVDEGPHKGSRLTRAVFSKDDGRTLVVVDSQGNVAVSRGLVTRPAKDVPSWVRLLP